MNGLFASLIRHEYFADVIQGNLRMFIRSNIRKLLVTTSAYPQIRILPPAPVLGLHLWFSAVYFISS